MSTVTWNGSSADWNTSGDWSGGQTPGALDTAAISSGAVVVGTNDGISAGSLSLTGGSLTVKGGLTLVTANGGNGYVPTVNISGGSLTVDGGSLAFGAYLNGASGTVVVTNFGSFQWNGTSPSLVNGTTGSTSGLTIDLQSGYANFLKPFDGQIKDFSSGDSLNFGAKITNESYANNVLSVDTDAGLSYKLNIVGSYQAYNFAVSSDQFSISYSNVPQAAAPTITGLTTATDSGTRGDNRTDQKPSISGTGTTGDTITVYLDNSSTALGTTTVVNGTWTFNFSTTPSAGSHSVTATDTHDASTSPRSAAYSFVIDPVPQAPSVTGLTAGTDTGSSSTDGVTNDTSVGARGTGTTGDTINVYVDGSAVSAGSVTVTNGAWSIAALNGTLNQGTHAIRATQTDTHGNVSSPSSNYSVTVDTTAPTVAVALADDTGTAGDGVTSDQALTGTAETGHVVTVQNGGTALGTATVDAQGKWNFAPTLADGTYTLTASEDDTAGNTGTATLSFTIDTTPPAITISAPIADDDAINATEAAAGVTISGTTTAEDGQTVTVRILNAASTAVGSYTVAASAGAYAVAVTPTEAQALADGEYTVTADVSDKAGNPALMASQSIVVDETEPTVTALSEGGPGVDADGNGTLGAGRTVTLTVTTSEPVTVAGGTPTLTLNDDGTATYSGGSGTNQLTFSYTVAAGQNTAKLAVTAVNTNGATVTDAAGNPITASLAGASVPSGTLVIDTAPPVASSSGLTAAQNAGPTPIGLAAPSDNLTATGSLAIVVGRLPSDGTVTLADGTTPVVAGQSLTAAQLAGLAFTPTPGAFGQGSTFTYTVTDTAGNAGTGTAALNVGGPGAPTITGTHASTTSSEGPVSPFAGVTVADPSGGVDTLTIALTGGGGTLSGAGLTANPDGTYTLGGTAGPNGTLTAALGALTFTPAAGAAGTTATTRFVLTDASGSGTSVVDNGTTVANTDPLVVAPPTNNSPGTAPAGTVSLDPAVSYGHGVFTLTGRASSAAGVAGVEISAVLNDGTRQDLGAATVNADGSFSFADRIGRNKQSFLEATLTDGAGVQTVSADPGFNLTGGLAGGAGRQNSFSTTEQVSTALFRPNGQRTVDVQAPGQTVDLQPLDIVFNHHQADTTFVFSPGDGLDVIHGFKAGGAGHDTLSLPGADFHDSIAAVLRNTGDIQGSAFITDPVTGDAIRLAGVTTAELKAQPRDFTFHA